MPKYNHAYTIAFEVVSSHPKAYDVTAGDLILALQKRLNDLSCDNNTKGIIEACGEPFDTYEM